MFSSPPATETLVALVFQASSSRALDAGAPRKGHILVRAFPAGRHGMEHAASDVPEDLHELAQTLDVADSGWPVPYDLGNPGLGGSACQTWRVVALLDGTDAGVDGAWGTGTFQLKRQEEGRFGGRVEKVDVRIDGPPAPRNAPGKVGPIPLEDVAAALFPSSDGGTTGILIVSTAVSDRQRGRIRCDFPGGMPVRIPGAIVVRLVDPLDETREVKWDCNGGPDEDPTHAPDRCYPRPPPYIGDIRVDYVAEFNGGAPPNIQPPPGTGKDESDLFRERWARLAAYACQRDGSVVLLVLGWESAAYLVFRRVDHVEGHWRMVGHGAMEELIY